MDVCLCVCAHLWVGVSMFVTMGLCSSMGLCVHRCVCVCVQSGES